MNSIREGYEKLGVDNYYKTNKDTYENPHSEIISSLLEDIKTDWDIKGTLLDLGCGSGEVSNHFKKENIEGLDAYTKDLYERKTGFKCKEKTFKDILEEGLDKKYDYIISSFALHLCEESMLQPLLYRLSESTNNLIIITPHKRPNCNGPFFKEYKRKKLDKVSVIWYKSIV